MPNPTAGQLAGHTFADILGDGSLNHHQWMGNVGVQSDANSAAITALQSGGSSSTFSVVSADTTGAADAVAAFTTADALAADKWIPPGTYKLSSNVTLTGRYWFSKGAVLVPDAGVLVTMAGTVVAQHSRLFNVAAAGSRVFVTGFSPSVRPEWWGAVGDGTHVLDAAITSGAAVLTSASNPWSAADVGKTIGVTGAAGTNVTLTTTILSYQSAGQVTLAANASVTVSNVEAQWGTDDRIPIQACIDSCAHALFPRVEFLGKWYVVSRNGANAWSLDLSRNTAADGTVTSGSTTITSPSAQFTKDDEGAYVQSSGNELTTGTTTIVKVTSPTTAILSAAATGSASAVRVFTISSRGITLHGVRGKTRLKHPTGMPNAQVVLLRMNGSRDCSVLEMGFDGSWGQDGTVQFAPGINHVTQADPKNHGIFVRGCTNTTIAYCDFQQIYGDAIWNGLAFSINLTSQVTSIHHNTFNFAGRNGLTMSNPVDDMLIDANRFKNIHTSAIDTEPVQGYVRTVKITNNWLGVGWNTTSIGNNSFSIAGGTLGRAQDATMAKTYVVTGNTIYGQVIIEEARNVQMTHNTFITDWTTTGSPCISIDHNCDDLDIGHNYFYNSSAPGTTAEPVIQVQAYVAAAPIKPANVSLHHNTILARNGRHGIKVQNTGQAPDWSNVTQYATGNAVRYLGITYQATATPTVGVTPDTGGSNWAVWIEADSDASGGYVTVEDNLIDCTDDGTGAGGIGIYLATASAGMRAIVRRNRIRQATTSGVFVRTSGSSSLTPYLHLEIVDNEAWDDKVVPTCLSVVKYESPQWITNWIMRGNHNGQGVAASVTGVTAGFWQVIPGTAPTYAGYGTPLGNVAAPIGARYQRLDGGTDSTTYRKESATDATGWVADTALPANAVQHAFARKTVDQSVTSADTGTTLVDCTGLTFAVAANDIWEYEFVIYYQAAVAGDLKLLATVPASPVAHAVGAIGTSINGVAGQANPGFWGATNAAVAATIGGGDATKLIAVYKGLLRNGANAGNVQLQMAQNTASATATTVFTDSYVKAHRIFPA